MSVIQVENKVNFPHKKLYFLLSVTIVAFAALTFISILVIAGWVIGTAMPEDTNVVVEKTISETIFGTPGGINRFIFFIVSLTSLIASAFLYIYFNKRFHHVEISKTVNLLIIVFITMLLLLGILYLIFFNFSIYAPISIASCAIILVAAIVQRVSFKTQEHSKIFQLQQIKDLKESRNDKIDNIILVADEFRRVHTKNKNLITLKYADNIVKSSKNTLA